MFDFCNGCVSSDEGESKAVLGFEVNAAAIFFVLGVADSVEALVINVDLKVAVAAVLRAFGLGFGKKLLSESTGMFIADDTCEIRLFVILIVMQCECRHN
jgi:hypothetical protein